MPRHLSKPTSLRKAFLVTNETPSLDFFHLGLVRRDLMSPSKKYPESQVDRLLVSDGVPLALSARKPLPAGVVVLAREVETDMFRLAVVSEQEVQGSVKVHFVVPPLVSATVSRLNVIVSSSVDHLLCSPLVVGQLVMARASDGFFYPGCIRAKLSPSLYRVEFVDGDLRGPVARSDIVVDGEPMIGTFKLQPGQLAGAAWPPVSGQTQLRGLTTSLLPNYEIQQIIKSVRDASHMKSSKTQARDDDTDRDSEYSADDQELVHATNSRATKPQVIKDDIASEQETVKKPSDSGASRNLSLMMMDNTPAVPGDAATSSLPSSNTNAPPATQSKATDSVHENTIPAQHSRTRKRRRSVFDDVIENGHAVADTAEANGDTSCAANGLVGAELPMPSMPGLDILTRTFHFVVVLAEYEGCYLVEYSGRARRLLASSNLILSRRYWI